VHLLSPAAMPPPSATKYHVPLRTSRRTTMAAPIPRNLWAAKPLLWRDRRAPLTEGPSTMAWTTVRRGNALCGVRRLARVSLSSRAVSCRRVRVRADAQRTFVRLGPLRVRWCT
jgi:hypothetical protein